jgi:hypothetical protein
MHPTHYELYKLMSMFDILRDRFTVPLKLYMVKTNNKRKSIFVFLFHFNFLLNWANFGLDN